MSLPGGLLLVSQYCEGAEEEPQSVWMMHWCISRMGVWRSKRQPPVCGEFLGWALRVESRGTTHRYGGKARCGSRGACGKELFSDDLFHTIGQGTAAHTDSDALGQMKTQEGRECLQLVL